MMIREQPATDLTVATRILARAGALGDTGRITMRLGDVVYVAARGVSSHTMTPYDVVAVLVADGTSFAGDPPDDIGAYIAVYRTDAEVQSVARGNDGALLRAASVRACAIGVLSRHRGTPDNDPATLERTWLDLVAEAKVAGALIGAFPTGQED